MLHCAKSGSVDTVRELRTGQDRALTVVTDSPVLSWADGSLRVGDVGPAARWETIGITGESVVTRAPALVTSQVWVAAAVAGQTVALAFLDRLEVSWDGGPLRTHIPARPVPPQLAVGSGFVAWVERDGGSDVVRVRTDTGRDATYGAGARARMPVAQGTFLAFVDADGVNGVVSPGRPEAPDHRQVAWTADTGFRHPPAVASDLGGEGAGVCWEDRAALRAGTGDIDVVCASGVRVLRVGDQSAPSILRDDSGWSLLFRDGEQLWLATWSVAVDGQPAP